MGKAGIGDWLADYRERPRGAVPTFGWHGNILRLRRAISHWYQRCYGVHIDADKETIVTIGSKEGLAHLMLATLDRGDTVLVPDPRYPIHIYGAVIAGADIRSIPLIPGVDFFDELEKAIRGSYPKPKMMVLGFPSNPTAQCVELDFFEHVVALARKHQILVVHDLAYADIVFDGWKAPSIMQVAGAKEVAVEFFTLSKSYNMAGWMEPTPKASMSIWAPIPPAYAALGSLAFAKLLLAQAKVCVSPDIGFGDHGDDHVRFALIENEARIRQAVRGIKAMLKAGPAGPAG